MNFIVNNCLRSCSTHKIISDGKNGKHFLEQASTPRLMAVRYGDGSTIKTTTLVTWTLSKEDHSLERFSVKTFVCTMGF